MKRGISVIVPVFNGEALLGQCLDNLIHQSFTELEIILINDGSTDNTSSICDTYARQDKRIKVIHKDNTGLSDTRNVGVQLAEREYLMFVDADDWINPDTCEIAHNLIKDKHVDLVMWSYVREYKNRALPKKIDLLPGYYDRNKLTYYIHRRMIGLLGEELKHPANADSISTVCTKLYKTELLRKEKIKFIDTKIVGTEDALFNLYAFRKINSVYFFNQPLYHYRKYNDSSLTKRYNPELFHRWQNLHYYMEKFIEEGKLPAYFTDALNNRRCLSIIGLGLTELEESNPKNYLEKLKYLSDVLKTPAYKQAFKNFNLKQYYLQPHWLLFFACCKINFPIGLYFLLWLMKRFKKVI